MSSDKGIKSNNKSIDVAGVDSKTNSQVRMTPTSSDRGEKAGVRTLNDNNSSMSASTESSIEDTFHKNGSSRQTTTIIGKKEKPARDIGQPYSPNHSYYNDPVDFQTIEIHPDTIIPLENISIYEHHDEPIDVDKELRELRDNCIAFWLFGFFIHINWFVRWFGEASLFLQYQAYYQNFGRFCPVGKALWDWMLIAPGALGKLLCMLCMSKSDSSQLAVIIIFGSASGFLLVASIPPTETLFSIALALSKLLAGYAELYFLFLSLKYDGSAMQSFISGTGFCPIATLQWYMLLRELGVSDAGILSAATLAWAAIGIAYKAFLHCANPLFVRPLHHNHNTCQPFDGYNFEQLLLYPLRLLHVALPFVVENLCMGLLVFGAVEYQFRATENFTIFEEQYSLLMSFFIGNLLARSFSNTVNLLEVYLYTILQCVNCAMVIYDTIHTVIPQLAQMMVIYFLVGVVSGTVYQNLYCWLAVYLPTGSRRFGIGFISICGDIGFGLAMALRPLLHDCVCTGSYVSPLREFLGYHFLDMRPNVWEGLVYADVDKNPYDDD